MLQHEVDQFCLDLILLEPSSFIVKVVMLYHSLQFSFGWAIECIFARRNSKRISASGNKSEAIEMRILHRGGKGLHRDIIHTAISRANSAARRPIILLSRYYWE
jgi:hypothetical protein